MYAVERGTGLRGNPGRVPRLDSVGVVGSLSRCGEGDLGDDRREDNSKISFGPDCLIRG